MRPMNIKADQRMKRMITNSPLPLLSLIRLYSFNSCHSLIIFFFLLMLIALPAGAQTAAEVEALLESPAVSRSEASRFTAAAVFDTAIGGFNGGASGNAPPTITAEGSIRLDEAALLLMEAFDATGGAGYTIFRNRHYAYRELRHRGIIRGRTDPADTVPGETFLYMIHRMLALQESAEGAALREGGAALRESGLIRAPRLSAGEQ